MGIGVSGVDRDPLLAVSGIENISELSVRTTISMGRFRFVVNWAPSSTVLWTLSRLRSEMVNQRLVLPDLHPRSTADMRMSRGSIYRTISRASTGRVYLDAKEQSFWLTLLAMLPGSVPHRCYPAFLDYFLVFYFLFFSSPMCAVLASLSRSCRAGR